MSELARKRLSSTRLPERCGPVRIDGELEASTSPGEVQVKLRGDVHCAQPTREVFEVHRGKRLNPQGAFAVAVGIGSIIGVGLVAGYAAASNASPPRGPGERELVSHLIGWSGLAFGTLLGAIPAALLVAPVPTTREVVERFDAEERRTVVVTGSLVSSARGREWPLVDGAAALELATLDETQLETATVDAIPVTWSPAARERLTGLRACRAALAEWVESAAPDCRRLEPALRCTEGGWALTARLEASLAPACPRQAGAADSRPAPSARPALLPAALPSTSGFMPGRSR